MSLQLLGYLIFLSTIIFVMIRIGFLLHKHGIHYIQHIFRDQDETAKQVNDILLIGYYLVNIGYAIISITNWETITSSIHLVGLLSNKMAQIFIILGVMHYINISILYSFAYLTKSNNNNYGKH